MANPARQQSKPLSRLQLELLKLYSTEVSSDELWEVKRLLGQHFGRRAIQSADRVWDERELTNEDMDAWLDE